MTEGTSLMGSVVTRMEETKKDGAPRLATTTPSYLLNNSYLLYIGLGSIGKSD